MRFGFVCAPLPSGVGGQVTFCVACEGDASTFGIVVGFMATFLSCLCVWVFSYARGAGGVCFGGLLGLGGVCDGPALVGTAMSGVFWTLCLGFLSLRFCFVLLGK